MEQIEIDQIVNLNTFVPPQVIQISPRIGPIPVLMHTSSQRIIGIAKFFMSVESLLDHNTTERNSLSTVNPSEEYIIETNKMWLIRHDKSKECWKKDLNVTHDQVEYFTVLNQKLEMLDILNNYILYSTLRLANKTPYEQLVLTGRLNEINSIKLNSISSDAVHEYPLISSYASFRDISLLDAVNEIEFKIQNDFAHISELENLRLRYSKISNNC